MHSIIRERRIGNYNALSVDAMFFSFQTEVPLARDTVYRFYQNPANILLLHAGWSNIRVLKHVGCVYAGAETSIEITMAGFLPLVLGFRHANFQPPHRFTDQLIHGPFKTFLHVHQFEEGSGGTQIHDFLEITLPAWLGGEMATRLLIAPMVYDAFRHRAAVLKRLASDGTLLRASKSSPPTGDA
jgi:ligand-binding SRPBCC domain-containing protein